MSAVRRIRWRLVVLAPSLAVLLTACPGGGSGGTGGY